MSVQSPGEAQNVKFPEYCTKKKTKCWIVVIHLLTILKTKNDSFHDYFGSRGLYNYGEIEVFVGS